MDVAAMKPGQIAQLQDLSKCYMTPSDRFDFDWISLLGRNHLWKSEKATLHRLTHQYRHQITAMRRNQKSPHAAGIGGE